MTNVMIDDTSLGFTNLRVSLAISFCLISVLRLCSVIILGAHLFVCYFEFLSCFSLSSLVLSLFYIFLPSFLRSFFALEVSLRVLLP
jgi:hypothetical protein